jgi:hypothetical protein
MTIENTQDNSEVGEAVTSRRQSVALLAVDL